MIEIGKESRIGRTVDIAQLGVVQNFRRVLKKKLEFSNENVNRLLYRLDLVGDRIDLAGDKGTMRVSHTGLDNSSSFRVYFATKN